MNGLEVMPEVNDEFSAGTLVGERNTLSKLAGSCSAADAICLRKLRESKQYLSKAKSWEEFCPKYLGMSRASADRLIRHLEEFGPESFETMQQLGLTPKEYRLLAPRVKEKALHYAGDTIRLLPENGLRIHAALHEIRRETPAPARQEPSLEQRLRVLGLRSIEMVNEFRALCLLEPGDEERQRISETLQVLRASLAQTAMDHELS
jgi:hypothetical protein